VSLPEPGRTGLITRGVERLLVDHGLSPLREFTLPSGRRADILALSREGRVWIVEVKSCLQDFLSDHKWAEYPPYCDRFYFGVGADFPQDRLPLSAGLIVADAFGGEIIREAAETPLPGPRRRSLTLQFAHAAAGRLFEAGSAP